MNHPRGLGNSLKKPPILGSPRPGSPPVAAQLSLGLLLPFHGTRLLLGFQADHLGRSGRKEKHWCLKTCLYHGVYHGFFNNSHGKLVFVEKNHDKLDKHHYINHDQLFCCFFFMKNWKAANSTVPKPSNSSMIVAPQWRSHPEDLQQDRCPPPKGHWLEMTQNMWPQLLYPPWM